MAGGVDVCPYEADEDVWHRVDAWDDEDGAVFTPAEIANLEVLQAQYPFIEWCSDDTAWMRLRFLAYLIENGKVS